MESTALKTIALLIGMVLAAVGDVAPVEAGGWGHGPSWKQAKKDAGQAATNVKKV